MENKRQHRGDQAPPLEFRKEDGQVRIPAANLFSRAKWLISLQFIFFLLLVAYWIFGAFRYPLDPNYTSGELWDTYLAWRDGAKLYPPLAELPFRVLNYPPLYFGLLQAEAYLPLSALAWGRLLNIISLGFILTGLYRWMRREDCSPWVAAWVVGLSACSFPLIYNSAQFHFQNTAVALSLWGLYFIQGQTKAGRFFLGGALLALACFVKQTQAITLLAGFFWLLRYRRGGLLPWLGGVVLVGGLGSLIITVFFGTEAWRHLILYTVGIFSPAKLLRQFKEHLLPWAGFLLLAGWWGFRNPPGRRSLRWWYFVASTLWLLATLRKGSGSAYFIEWAVATLLWLGPAFQQLFHPETKRPSPWTRFWVAILALQVLAADLGVAAVLDFNLRTLHRKSQVLAEFCPRLQGEGQLIVTGNPAWARACGKLPSHHPFIMASLAKQGLWNQEPFLQRLGDGSLPLIWLPFDPTREVSPFHQERWTPEMIASIRKNYRMEFAKGPWWLLKYAPFRPQETP